MTAYELALLVCDLEVAGLDPADWMPRIRPGVNTCEVFARSVPDNKDYFDRVDGPRSRGLLVLRAVGTTWTENCV